MLNKILLTTFWHNKVYEYLLVLGFLMLGVFLIKLTQRFILSKLSKSVPERIKQSFSKVKKNITSLLYVSIFYTGLQFLYFAPKVDRVMDIVIASILAIFFIHILNNSLLDYVVKRYFQSNKYGNGLLNVQFFLALSKILVWIIGLLILADNLGLKVTPLMAGLGISGVAVALAAQVLLKDLFSYFAIYFDRPFNVGDFIIIGDFLGTVEHVGIKTTRLRSLGGEELILSNSDLTESRVRNYKRMQKRRILFDVKVVYDTPQSKLQLIPEAIKKAIESVADVTYDRAHLARFNEYGFMFEVVYYVLSSDYGKYMDVQQEINFAIVKYFADNKIIFASFPKLFHESS